MLIVTQGLKSPKSMWPKTAYFHWGPTAAAPCVVGTHYTIFTAVAASCVLSAREPGPHNSIHCCGLHNSNHCIVCTHCQGGAAAAVVTTVSRPPACASRPWNREDVGACCCWWRRVSRRRVHHCRVHHQCKVVSVLQPTTGLNTTIRWGPATTPTTQLLGMYMPRHYGNII